MDLTENLTNIIYNQERSLDNYDKEGLKNRINIHKAAKEQHLNDEYNEISTMVNSNLKHSMELAREKGFGSWLIALPIQTPGYVLNKQE